MRSCAVICLLISLPATAHERVTTEVTYDREVVRILRDKCVRCHDANDKVPLSSYAQVRPWAKAIRDEVESGRMPPWPPARGVGDLAEDRALTPRAAEVLIAWVEGGAPEGDAPDLIGANESRVAPGPIPNAVVLRVKGSFVLDTSMVVHAVKPLTSSGRPIELRAQLPDGSQRPLIAIPVFQSAYAWDYPLRAPLTLPKGTRLVVFGGKPATVDVTVTEAPASRSPKTAP